jgi:hypothetical protein
MFGSCVWTKSHLLPCQIKPGVHFLQTLSMLQRRWKRKQHVVVKRVVDMIMPKSDMYPEVKKRTNLMGPIVWQGKEYPPGVLPPEMLSEKFYGSCIRLTSFMNCYHWTVVLVPTWTYRIPPSYLKGKTQIARCFPLSSFRHVSIPSENDGLAADNLETRFGFITLRP